MAYQLELRPSFIRDLKHFARNGGDQKRVRKVLALLQSGNPLPTSLKDHQLQGKLRPYRECHIEGDRLLVYEKDGKTWRIICIWLVTHKKLRERERAL